MKNSKRMQIRQRLFDDVAMNIHHAVSIVFEIEDFIKYDICILRANFETFVSQISNNCETETSFCSFVFNSQFENITSSIFLKFMQKKVCEPTDHMMNKNRRTRSILESELFKEYS